MEQQLIIIGAGPAGISAALYARRAGLAVTVVTKGPGALAKAEGIENYYGFTEPVTGAELEQRGIEGAKRLGVQFVTGEVLQIGFNDTFDGYKVEGADFTLEAPSLVLAAGAARQTLAVPGLKEYEGKGVSYCAVCDAFFYRQKRVAVIGAGAYALHEAEALAPHAREVHILTNGEPPQAAFPADMIVHTGKIAAIVGDERVAGVQFADGSAENELAVDGVFLAIGTAGSTALARKLGILLDGANIKADDTMATNVPGVFAAGDCTGGLLQVAKAVYEGAKAGLAAVKYVRAKAKA
ncbi:NAD(P)/FAD-dependent oxidoreductase [Selenomonas sp.]|uniref:NAD(P)/FAD-dependent oxidoreductase n=1 Tax=Selenomonas sp. TaxID=2053611 RepID=UPI0025E9D0A8|nr:FAD-dependent oxidoreductase [Selenomonas sp.]MCI6086723.1 FAD-dependent oxidoreductase [Selenomonas sp.]MDY3296863.1 FAD-dependent oxidoreductase [Selenomonas sp.]MDY4416869.1 FAD-dependent oxidoreductase [Selenomonas sp.]